MAELCKRCRKAAVRNAAASQGDRTQMGQLSQHIKLTQRRIDNAQLFQIGKTV